MKATYKCFGCNAEEEGDWVAGYEPFVLEHVDCGNGHHIYVKLPYQGETPSGKAIELPDATAKPESPPCGVVAKAQEA